MRVLADNGYLPLVAPDLSPERLNRAAMLISIAPGKAFSRDEIAAVQEFVAAGRFLPQHGGIAGGRAEQGVAGRVRTSS